MIAKVFSSRATAAAKKLSCTSAEKDYLLFCRDCSSG